MKNVCVSDTPSARCVCGVTSERSAGERTSAGNNGQTVSVTWSDEIVETVRDTDDALFVISSLCGATRRRTERRGEITIIVEEHSHVQVRDSFDGKTKIRNKPNENVFHRADNNELAPPTHFTDYVIFAPSLPLSLSSSSAGAIRFDIYFVLRPLESRFPASLGVRPRVDARMTLKYSRRSRQTIIIAFFYFSLDIFVMLNMIRTAFGARERRKQVDFSSESIFGYKFMSID